MMSQESDIDRRYDLISALQTLCEDANVLLQAYGGVPPDLAAAIAEHAAAIDPALEGAPLRAICRAATLMPRPAIKRQATWQYGKEKGEGERERQQDEKEREREKEKEKEKETEWEERGEGRARAPSPLGWFEVLPSEMMSEILRYPGTRRLGTTSKTMRERVAAEDVWEQRKCEREVVPLPLEAACINANPDPQCVKVCRVALTADPRVFLARLLRAAFFMLGINPDTAQETGPSRALWWPVTPRVGHLMQEHEEEDILAFQPMVRTPLPRSAPISEWDESKLPQVDLVLTLRPCGTAGAPYGTRLGYRSREAYEDMVLRFAVTRTRETEGDRQWVVNWMLAPPVRGPPPRGPMSSTMASDLMFGSRGPLPLGTEGAPSRGARPSQTPEADYAYYADWGEVVAQLKEYVDRAMRAWHFQPLYFEIQFPGWLHIARADTGSLRDWTTLVHAAFDSLVIDGAFPVRTAEGRDGIVTESDVLMTPEIHSHPHIPFGISPFDPEYPDVDQWNSAVDAWAAEFFHELGGRVLLPYPGRYVAIHATLCFTFPYPIPPREGGTP
jgi:hypothetical protein